MPFLDTKVSIWLTQTLDTHDFPHLINIVAGYKDFPYMINIDTGYKLNRENRLYLVSMLINREKSFVSIDNVNQMGKNRVYPVFILIKWKLLYQKKITHIFIKKFNIKINASCCIFFKSLAKVYPLLVLIEREICVAFILPSNVIDKYDFPSLRAVSQLKHMLWIHFPILLFLCIEQDNKKCIKFKVNLKNIYVNYCIFKSNELVIRV